MNATPATASASNPLAASPLAAFEAQGRRAWESMRAAGHPVTTNEALFIAAVGNQAGAEVDGRTQTAAVWAKVVAFYAAVLAGRN